MSDELTPRPALITAPSIDFVDLETVKRHLNVDWSDHDDLIRGYLAAALAQLEPHAGGWLGRALRPQVWEMRLSRFPCGLIELPYPPFVSVDSFKYDDVSGVEQTLAAVTGYRVLGFTVGDQPPRLKVSLAPPYGGSWPSARCDHQSVRLRWSCGYAAGQADALLPQARAWVLLVCGSLYENRETAARLSASEQLQELPPHILNMLESIRIRS